MNAVRTMHFCTQYTCKGHYRLPQLFILGSPVGDKSLLIWWLLRLRATYCRVLRDFHRDTFVLGRRESPRAPPGKNCRSRDFAIVASTPPLCLWRYVFAYVYRYLAAFCDSGNCNTFSLKYVSNGGFAVLQLHLN